MWKKQKEDNMIVSFTTEQGVLNDHFPDVVEHFLGHFKGIMGKAKPPTMEIQSDCIAMGSKLTLDQQVHLLKPFSLKEVRAAMFSILNTKSPGPDRFGSGFLMSVWPEFPEELHRTTLSLIPKIDSPSKAIDYRPIACCTTLYNGVSKLICSRLANVLLALDILKNYRRKNCSPRCTIKIDISKAYDTVNWDFLKKLLVAYCFPAKFVKWIMNCVRNTSYSLLLNGQIQGSFKGE
ncbi:hypothetical protein CsatA_001551 [Cannabis sativa]